MRFIAIFTIKQQGETHARS